MQRTGGFVSIAQPNERNPWSAALAGSLAVFVVALSVVLALRTGWMDALLANMPGAGPGWVTVAVAAGILLSGVSLLWIALSHFAREVERAPYVWLAPIITALPSIALVAWRLPAPAPLPTRAFAIVWVPLLIGGGSLLQTRGLGRRAIGLSMLALPAAWVLGSMTFDGGMDLLRGWSLTPRPGQLFAAVVCLTCVGVASLALLTREQGARAEQMYRALVEERQVVAAERQSLAAERAGLDELVERAELALNGGRRTLDTQELALMRPRRTHWLWLALIPGLLAAGLVAFEFGHRRPMRALRAELHGLQAARAEAAAAPKEEPAQSSTDALSSLRDERDRARAERDRLAQALAALQAQTTPKAVVPGSIGSPPVRATKAQAQGPAAEGARARPAALATDDHVDQRPLRPAARKQRELRAARRRQAHKGAAKARASAKAAADRPQAPPRVKGTETTAPDPLRGTAAAKDNDPLGGLDL